jgi:hypothetical protein
VPVELSACPLTPVVLPVLEEAKPITPWPLEVAVSPRTPTAVPVVDEADPYTPTPVADDTVPFTATVPVVAAFSAMPVPL